MAKLLEINKCADCPFFEVINSGTEDCYKCKCKKLNEESIDLKLKYGIASRILFNCPLPDSSDYIKYDN